VAGAVLGQPTALNNWDRDVLMQRSLGGLRYHVLAAGERVATGTLGRGHSPLQVRAARFVSDFVVGPDRQVISRSDKMNNPALQVAWLQDGTTVSRQWLFLRPEFRQFSHEKSEMPRLELEDVEPRSDGQFQFHLAVRESSSNTPLGELALALGDMVRLGDSDDSAARDETQATTATIAKTAAPYEVVLLGTEPLFYTDLTVSYNPMIPVIYFGSVLAIAGICFALYGRRTTLSVWCRESDGRVQVAVQYWPSRSTLTLGVARTLEVLK
jgi:cytochrome c biogenesis protein ResB